MMRFLTPLSRLVLTLVTVTAALATAYGLWDYYVEAPWTRDGHVRADVVAIAPDVSGLVSAVLIKDNQPVEQGDVLFRIDPERFKLALREAEAEVEGRRAAFEQANADYRRYAKLSDSAVSQQKLESARADKLTAEADYHQALAARDLAKLNLERSEVRASVSGQIVNMDLQPGTYVTAGNGVMALIDRASIRVEGYFEETKLPRIHIGDHAVIHLMGDDERLEGHVESIAGGIGDSERTNSSNLLADIEPTFAWVRLAQRVPVRIKLDGVADPAKLVAGRTATISLSAPAP
ncbi:HlyD family secretion protein [Methyloligella sp. 2.7D]|uniref:efflux RND transporter periplasmic adaptor subunit n=1 Tax=unclassified Methyloligella TaxID=2625955 RepID=UPI00157E062A|nr:HlyD family secretion protein [Methyloligella sp. GL2]QKP77244.1 HlyD family secretion protein [Methyloligella sp. GL2]